MTKPNPHLRQPVVYTGEPLADARAAAILVHGRERDTDDILGLSARLALDGFAWIAPAAADHSWYPQRFMAPLEENQPGLDHALERIDTLVEELIARGFDTPRIALIGFSQGACLVTEYAIRHARRYGAVIGLTGGLIGPPGTRWEFGGDMQGTPVLLATSDVDEWVPVSRVQESAAVFRARGASVQVHVYPGMDHIVNDDEVAETRRLLEPLAHPA